jgi:hypothetical protein
MGAVGEVQAGNIHTGLAHSSQSLLIFAGGTDGADDFSFSHSSTSYQ